LWELLVAGEREVDEAEKTEMGRGDGLVDERWSDDEGAEAGDEQSDSDAGADGEEESLGDGLEK
jgi:hypothetical protein